MMNTNKFAARAFGISFLIGYISYGMGFGLLNSMLNAPDSLATVFSCKNQVIFEASILMAVFAPINIVLGVIMTPIFKPYSPALAYGYLSAAIASTLLLVVGAICLLLTIPISEAFIHGGSAPTNYLELLFELCKKANFFAYQIAMVIWGLGGLVFAYLLLISKLVPRWLTIWGLIGYFIFVAGAFFALFGYSIDVMMDIPGGLFEVFLSVRLIVKGFDPVAPKLAKA